MKRGSVVPVIVILLLAGCASKKGFNRGAMTSAAQESHPLFQSSNLTIEQIEQLKAQVHLPVRLAVAPPIISYGQRWGNRELNTWNTDETKEIESWAGPLKKAGVISEVVILPAVLLEKCQGHDPGCNLRVCRSATARIQADALLLINLASAVEKYTNQASLLDVTIIGLWLVPGHHRDALTIAEGVMIDNRNEYLYAYARGEAEEKTVRPYMYASSWKAVRPSRLRALQSFGREFIREAGQLKKSKKKGP
jgi:rhombotail lipoprotein